MSIITMPQAGQSMEEGTILRWLKQEGDSVIRGEILLEVDTDKATVEVEASESGVLRKILCPEGATVPVLAPIAVIAGAGEDVRSEVAAAKAELDAALGGPPISRAAPSAQPAPADPEAAALPGASGAGSVKASPAARRFGRELGVDLRTIQSGTGPYGRILSSDVIQAASQPSPAAGAVRRPLAGRQRAIARAMQAAKQSIPHFYMKLTIDAGPLYAFYCREKAAYHCTINDIVTLACARAVKEFPAFRSRIEGEDEVAEYPAASIGVAVGMDEGLVVPVVIGAESMSLRQMAAETARIVEAARSGEVVAMGQGVFTISNLGGFGVEEFTAIINPPESGILAVGAIRETVIVKDSGMRPGRVMTMTLSADHRLIDGLMAARFLNRLKEQLEAPEELRDPPGVNSESYHTFRGQAPKCVVERGLDRLRRIAMPAEMWQEASQGLSLPSRPAVNAHIHLPPNFSAFESVEQAVELAARQNLSLLGASNYYDYSIYATFLELSLGRGIYPLFGLEIICLLGDLQRTGVLINDPANPGRMYVCGRGITRFGSMPPGAARLLERMRRNDRLRIRNMIRLLSEVFEQRGIAAGLDEAKIIERIVRRQGVTPDIVVLQERHVAQAFQEELFLLIPEAGRTAVLRRILGVPSQAAPGDHIRVQNEIRAHLMKAGKPAFVEECFLSFDEAFGLILELGGIPCYPVLADGASPICAYEDAPEKLIETLKARRVFCAEFIPLRNEPEVLKRYAETMRDAGLVITAGTEHNTLDPVPLEPACIKGMPVPETVKEIFVEGAYVIVAHQYLRLHGLCGYVDELGGLNPAFAGVEERIRQFRRLGAAVVARQLAMNFL